MQKALLQAKTSSNYRPFAKIGVDTPSVRKFVANVATDVGIALTSHGLEHSYENYKMFADLAVTHFKVDSQQKLVYETPKVLRALYAQYQLKSISAEDRLTYDKCITEWAIHNADNTGLETEDLLEIAKSPENTPDFLEILSTLRKHRATPTTWIQAQFKELTSYPGVVGNIVSVKVMCNEKSLERYQRYRAKL